MIQIAPLPPASVVQTAQTPQSANSVLPAVQGQATPPITAGAVTPAPKSESGQKIRRKGEKNEDEGKENEREKRSEDGRGGNVNISI